MLDRQQDFTDLMHKVRSGSDDAARELVDKYGSHILRIVRRKLSKALRTKFDSADFVQAVWASFFALPLTQYRFDRSEALVAFLIDLARNKVVEVVRQRLQTQKYNVNRERSLDEGTLADSLVARAPLPEAVVIARDEWQRLLSGQPEHYRAILLSLGSGETQQEAAHRQGVDERTVRRVVRKLAPRPSHESN